MRIDIDDEYKKLCSIQQIKPGRLRYCIIILSILLTIITVGIPLILYWKWQKFRNFIHLLVFQQAQQDSQQITYYLIIDSKKLQGKSRKIIYRNFIISPYLIQKQSVLNPYTGLMNQQQELCKYFEHKNLKYIIKNNGIYSLKFKIHKTLKQCFSNGLSPQQINQSVKIYGKAETFLLSFHHVFNKILHTKRLRIVFMFFAIKKIIVGLIGSQKQQNSFLVSFIILSQIMLAYVMMLGMSIFGSRQHNKIHEKIQNQVKYEVIRQGQNIEVKLNDLYVGDIVIPKKGQIIYFKGLIAAELNSQQHIPYMIVNEKLYNRIDKPIEKTSLLSHLNQVSQINTINPGSLILNMDVKKDFVARQNHDINMSQQQKDVNFNFYIIVTNNNFLRKSFIIPEKFYKSYREPCYYDNFQSIRHTFNTHQLIFETVFFLLAFIGIIMAEMVQKSKQNWIQILISLIALCFPFNLALFTTFTQMISAIRLRKKQISIINPSIEQVGVADQIFLELSAFQKIQFPGYIKKQRCARMALPEKFQDSSKLFEIFRRAKEESVFTFLGWTGIMNLPYFTSEPILKQIFEKADFYIKQKSQYDNEDKVLNNDTTAIKIVWKEVQRFSISQKFIQSVIIQDNYTNRFENKYFAIIQGQYTSEDCEQYFDQIVEEVGREQYKDIMKRLYLQGKKVKYISLKRLNGNDKNFNIQNLKREDIQKKLLFGGFLVFDHWPTESNIKILMQIDSIANNIQDSGIKVSIFSTRQQNALIGYDHILRNSQILFEQQSKERFSQIQQRKSDYQGVLHVGNGILDRGCLLIADVSVNKLSQSYVPADFLISKSQNVQQLLSEGVWAMQTTILTIICLSLFNFCKIVGQLVLFHNDHEEDIEAQPLSQSIDRLFLIDVGALIIPLFLLNIYKPTEKLVKKEHRSFFRVDLMFHVFITLVGMLALFMIEFLDHQFEGMCSLHEENLNKKHQMFLRHNQFHQFFNPKKVHLCEGIIDFVNISFALIVIFVMDRSTQSRKAKNLFLGLINKIYMIILWIVSIFYFHIPSKTVFRSLIVILALVALVYLTDFLKANKVKQQEIGHQINQNNEQIENQEL